MRRAIRTVSTRGENIEIRERAGARHRFPTPALLHGDAIHANCTSWVCGYRRSVGQGISSSFR